ncbi:carbonic anhydrase [Microbaculum marinum]|uniref:carbonic anhydrase n=1 Tax=Microbaculum marinum TaxID=1764581 RepID=A0AAW9RKE5_9HYPH
MFGAAALGAAAGLASMGMRPAFAQQNAISPDDALKRIMDGNARYVANTPNAQDFAAGRAARAQGQHPVAGILSCADSRVAPEIVFDEGLGDLFVVRVAGNTVNTDGLASMEFGHAVLGMPLIMVLGHTSCGAIDGAIGVVRDGTVLPGHLPQLVESIKPAVVTAKEKSPDDLLLEATKQNVLNSVESLSTGSQILSDAIAGGKLKIVGAMYELSSGKVTML